MIRYGETKWCSVFVSFPACGTHLRPLLKSWSSECVRLRLGWGGKTIPHHIQLTSGWRKYPTEEAVESQSVIRADLKPQSIHTNRKHSSKQKRPETGCHRRSVWLQFYLKSMTPIEDHFLLLCNTMCFLFMATTQPGDYLDFGKNIYKHIP